MLSKENLQYFPTENTLFMKNENQDEENMIFMMMSMQIEIICKNKKFNCYIYTFRHP